MINADFIFGQFAVLPSRCDRELDLLLDNRCI